MTATLKRFIYVLVLALSIVACKKDAARDAKKQLINELVETNPPVLKAVTKVLNDVTGGYYSGLPYHYNETTKNYPLLIFIHGGGQFGNGKLDLPLLLNDGVPQLLDAKTFPPNFTVNGKNYSYIILAPQFSRYPSNEEVAVFVDYAMKNYRIDPKRVYVSGLSMGGIIASDLGAQYTATFAAIVPISGVLGGAGIDKKCRNIATGNLPVWVFHNDRDPSISPVNPRHFIDEINKFSPSVVPRLTMFNAFGHDAWTQALDPVYKEDGRNIYEWMLQFSR